MEKVFNEKIWVPALNPFRFTEQVDPNTGKKRYIMKGLMLPFGKVSRNNVLYNKEAIAEKHQDLVGKPVMYNHDVEGQALPLGHFISSNIAEDGWYYEADIDPEERDIIRKLERGDLRHVSIQLIGGKVIERFDEENNAYTEAYVKDIIEGSVVPAPGFLDTTAKFAEAFKKKEDVTTTTGKGAIAKKLVKKKDEEGITDARPQYPMAEGVESTGMIHCDAKSCEHYQDIPESTNCKLKGVSMSSKGTCNQYEPVPKKALEEELSEMLELEKGGKK